VKIQEFPIKLGRHQQVSIYQVKTRKAGHEYVNYTVSFSFRGKQARRAFSDLAEAKDYASARVTELANGGVSILSLKAEAGADYCRAAQLLKPCGVSLELAAAQFAEAYKILGGLSLIEAAKQAAKANRGVKPNVTFGEAVDELLKDRELNGVSAKYLYNLKRMLHRFTGVFQETRLASLDGPMIKSFLDGLDCRRGHVPVTARTRNNYRAAIGVVFEFCKFKKYLAKDHESIEHIAEYKETPKPTEIYTPAEIEMLLTNAAAGYPELVPFLAIGAFAGIRHEEIVRLDWKDVSLAGGHITVQAGNAKTAARRMVPIAENLARWLTEFAKPCGAICYRRNMAEPLSRFVGSKSIRKTGFVWKRNALRHSFISYRLAEINDMSRAALEAGDSPAIRPR